MKTLQFLFLGLSLGLFVSCGEASDSKEGNTDSTTQTDSKTDPKPAATKYVVNADNSKVMFNGSSPKGGHIGSLGVKSANFMLSEDGISDGEAIIDLTNMTILDADLPDDQKEKLKGHLSSPDFFNVAEFPTITIKITGSEPYNGGGETAPDDLPEMMGPMFVEGPTHTLTGMVVTKGGENQISFPAKVDKNAAGDVTINAFLTMDRSEYGLRFMSDTEANVDKEVKIAIMASANAEM